MLKHISWLTFLFLVQALALQAHLAIKYQGVAAYESQNDRVLEIVELFLPDNPVIFEAGAHYGTDTVHFVKKWPEARIISFEPNPHAFELLTEATYGLPQVSIHNLAVNDYNGSAVLHICYGSTGDNPIFEGASSLLKAAPCQEIHYRGPDIVVPCVVLDDWCKQNGVDQIDFMWLDLEGLELQVLQSSPDILDSVKVIFTETNLFDFRIGMTRYEHLKSFLERFRFKQIAHWYTEGIQGNAIFVKKEDFEN